jgi:excisionase family DNA binding protein
MSNEKLIQEFLELKKQITESIVCKKDIMTLEEAATFLGISKSTLYKLNLINGIPHSKPAQKLIYYKRTDLEAWMMKNYNDSSVSLVSQVKPRKRRMIRA